MINLLRRHFNRLLHDTIPDDNFTFFSNLLFEKTFYKKDILVEEGMQCNDLEFGGISKDSWGNEKVGFSLNGKVSREDFGLTWNATLETGGVLISTDVKIAAEIQFVKQTA